MTYLNFFAKRSLKNPITVVTVSLTLLLLIITLVMNLRTYKTVLLSTHAQQNLSSAYRLKSMATQDLRNAKRGTDRHEAAVENYADALRDIKDNKALIGDLKNGRYRQSYKLALKQNNVTLAVARKSQETNSGLLSGMKREGFRLRALEKSGFKEQSEDYPVNALGYLASCFRYLLPVLLTVIIIFVLTQSFSERFVDKLDIGNLIPFTHGTISFADISAGLVVALGIVILISVFAFAIAGSTSAVGHWNYPMFTYVSGTSQMKFVSTGVVLLRTILLSLLFLLFTVVVCNFVSILTRNRMVSLFISIVILVALPLTTWLVIPMHAIAHLLPTTYLFSELTVTGELGKTFDNYQVTSGLGLMVMLVTSVLIMVLTWGIDWYSSH